MGIKEGDFKIIRDRMTVQREIKERFGEDTIKLAKVRLCHRCKLAPCFMLPLTTRGEDCPYFKLKEGKR